MKKIELGYLSACIGYDRRYTDTLTVSLDPKGGPDGTPIVLVAVNATNPIGGMDGPGGTYDSAAYSDRVKPEAKAVLEAVKRVIDRGHEFNFKRYGKPTKNTVWYANGMRRQGLNLALVKESLEYALALAKGSP